MTFTNTEVNNCFNITTQAEKLADFNVILFLTSGRKFKNLLHWLLGGE